MTTLVNKIISDLKKLSRKETQSKPERFGINAENFLGVSMPDLRAYAKTLEKNHSLAIALWKSRIHEAQILASLVDEPDQVTEKQFDQWTNEFNSWDVCDQVCINLFQKTPFAKNKAIEHSSSEKEYVKRCAFALMAVMAVHYKKEKDEFFLPFLKLIEKECTDDRNFVKKAVNWALRQIGKRNEKLNQAAIETAERIMKTDNKTARWIAGDALKELKQPLKRKQKK